MARSVWSDATEALRTGSPDLLRQGLFDLARAGADSDQRDLMMDMAPLHHCARQLGEKPAELFADVAARLHGDTADLVREFGKRRDIRPRGWRFVLDRDEAGPFYRPMSEGEDARETQRAIRGFLRWHPIWRRRYRRAMRRAR